MTVARAFSQIEDSTRRGFYNLWMTTLTLTSLSNKKTLTLIWTRPIQGLASYIIEGGHMELVNGVSGIYAGLLTLVGTTSRAIYN